MREKSQNCSYQEHIECWRERWDVQVKFHLGQLPDFLALNKLLSILGGLGFYVCEIYKVEKLRIRIN
jgi:hypothetical protein